MFTNAQNVARVTSTRALTHTHVFRSRRKTRCLEVNTTLFNKNDYNSASRLPQGEFRENLNLRLGNRQHWVDNIQKGNRSLRAQWALAFDWLIFLDLMEYVNQIEFTERSVSDCAFGCTHWVHLADSTVE